MQVADQHVVPAHVPDAQGQGGGGRGRQAFGHRCGRQTDRGPEHLQPADAPKDAHPEGGAADTEAEPHQSIAQMVQLPLQRRIRGFGLAGQGLNQADLGEAAGGHHHHQPFAAGHQGPHEHHIEPVRQGDIVHPQGLGRLDHGQAFAGQDGFVQGEMGGLHQAAVGGHITARPEHAQVAQGDFRGGEFLKLPLPHHQGGGTHHGLQGADGLLRLHLGLVADEGVAHHHPGDEHRVHQAPGEHREARRGPQKIDGQGVELLQKDAQARTRFGLGQPVGPETLPVLLDCLAAEAALRGSLPLLQSGFGLQPVPGFPGLVLAEREETLKRLQVGVAVGFGGGRRGRRQP
jgi:hypothetical protein